MCFCLFLLKIFLSVVLFEAISRMESKLPLACLTVENCFSPTHFVISSAANHAILC
jgi:hypothetical protein